MPDRRRRESKPRWNSLVAAAEVLTAPNVRVRTAAVGRPQGWQKDAWAYYDEIGELRFGVQWIANALSRVNLAAAMTPLGPGDEPTMLDWDDERITPVQRRAIELVDFIASGPTGQGQMLASFGVHLTVSGVAWLVIEPDVNDPTSDALTSWMVLSTDEVRTSGEGVIEIRVSEREWRPAHPDAIVVRVWRRHPRKQWEADAPTRGVLGVLREIDLLQKHIHASATSRLAGAGILAIPSEATFPPGQGPQTTQGEDPDDENITAAEDTFVETLIEAMTVPLTDRGSAASVVPLVIKIPGELVDKVTHLRFDTPFDDRVLALLESAIRRLALGLDIPPEILTGTSGMNHWGAWQVQEESITLHIEPLSETITNALSVGYLRPALEAEGFSREEIAEVMVWYDTTDLRTRPDRSKGAVEAYDRIELSGAALLRELGLSVDDMPDDAEKRQRIILDIVRAAPVAAAPLLAELGMISQSEIEAVETADEQPALEAPETPDVTPDAGIPETRDDGAEMANEEALVAASDVIVRRALERAGTRLRSAAGKGTPGGAAAIECPDPTRLHLTIDATEHADLTALLEGAWTWVPDLADRFAVPPAALVATLDAYTRALLAAGHEHDYGRLARALGVDMVG